MGLPAIGPWRPARLSYRTQTGVTLIELLIGLAIASIVLGLAVSTRGVFSNFVTTTAVNDVLTNLYYARTEALKRQRSVTMCRSGNGASCENGTNWHSGWIIFTDSNRNRVIDGDDELLRIGDRLDESSRLTFGSGFYSYLIFSATGEVFPRNTFKFCREGNPPRAIILFATGRARISHKDSGGHALKC